MQPDSKESGWFLLVKKGSVEDHSAVDIGLYPIKDRMMLTAEKTQRKILPHAVVKPYFQDKDFVLYNAESIAFLSLLPENSIDMVFADPPYNLSNGGFSVHAGRRVSVNKGAWDKSNGFKDD